MQSGAMTESKNTTRAEDEQKTRDQHASNYSDNKWTLIAFLVGVTLFFLFVHLGDPARGMAAAVAGGMVVITVMSCWNLRKHAWFWAIVAILASVHVPLILYVHWPDTGHMPAVSLLPFGMLDWAVMYGCIKLVEKVVRRG